MPPKAKPAGGVAAPRTDEAAEDLTAAQHQLQVHTRAAHAAKQQAQELQQRCQDSEAALAREKVLLREVTGGLRKRCKELEDEAWQQQKEHDAECAELRSRIGALEAALSEAHREREQLQDNHAEAVCSICHCKCNKGCCSAS